MRGYMPSPAADLWGEPQRDLKLLQRAGPIL